MKRPAFRMWAVLVAFTIYAAAYCTGDEVRPIKELPATDPSVVNGTVDTRFSREWWKVEYTSFKQAVAEKNTQLVVSVARESAEGWRYNPPATYIMLGEAINYLQKKGLDWQNDLITLITAKAELAQYMNPGTDQTKDIFAAEVLCAAYERAQVYGRSGQDLLALQELEHFYNEGRAERERLKNAPHPVPPECPFDDKDVLVALIEAHLALALAGDSAPSMAQQHFRAAFDYNSALAEYADGKQAFRWGNRKISAQFVNPVWSVSHLALYLARQMHSSPSEYIKLVGETVKKLTGAEPFSLNDSIGGREYLEAEGASETQLWDFLQIYKGYFSCWPTGINGFEYQNCALSQLQFAIQHRNCPNAEVVIAELSKVSFADPVLLEQFNRLQFAFQDILHAAPPKIPMASALDGIVKGMQTDAASASLPVDKNLTRITRVASLARQNPVSTFLLGLTLACFIALIAMRIRRALFRKD